MAVAKSYENYEICGEPFEVDKKMYVRIRKTCGRCGGSGNFSYNPMDGTTCFRCGGSGKEYKEVRWYTDKERAAQDRAAARRAEKVTATKESRKVKFAARNAFGFGEAGYITIFKGDRDTINNWAHETSPCRARFNLIFGWFCPSTLNYENLPVSIEPIRIEWNDVCDSADPEGLTMRPAEDVKKYVASLTTEPSSSTYQGVIGDWLEKEVSVYKKVISEGRYGVSNFYVLKDSDGNIYIWSTQKNLEENTVYHLKMKVKEHKDYEGVQQTVVWYCKESK